jgi:hypothetical protein
MCGNATAQLEKPALSLVLSIVSFEWRGVGEDYGRGQYMMTATPIKQSAAPVKSAPSGGVPSICQPHRRDKTTKIPP